MELNSFQEKAAEKLPQIELRFYEPLSKHTSFRIGGPAEVMAFPKTEGELSEVLKVSKNWTHNLLSLVQEPMFWPPMRESGDW